MINTPELEMKDKSFENCEGCNANHVITKNNKHVCSYCGRDAKYRELSIVVGDNNVVLSGNVGSVINIGYVKNADFH